MGYHYGKKCDCGCGHKAGYHKGGKTMKDVINNVYNMKGENYLDPTNKSIAEGFWSAGQPGRKNFHSKYGGKNY